MMKCTVTVGFTIRVMLLCVSMFMASCSGDEPADREIPDADKTLVEPPFAVVEWYPRPKHLPPPTPSYEGYSQGQQPLMPQPPATEYRTWQAEPLPATGQPARPVPGYVYRDTQSRGSWGQAFQPQQPGLPGTQPSQSWQQYQPRPWGETPAVVTRNNQSAAPVQQQGGTVNDGSWQPVYGGYPGYGYGGSGWGGW